MLASEMVPVGVMYRARFSMRLSEDSSELTGDL